MIECVNICVSHVTLTSFTLQFKSHTVSPFHKPSTRDDAGFLQDKVFHSTHRAKDSLLANWQHKIAS